jgi:hypothetical protein
MTHSAVFQAELVPLLRVAQAKYSVRESQRRNVFRAARYGARLERDEVSSI